MIEPSFIQKLLKTLQENVPHGEYRAIMEKALDTFGIIDAFELPPNMHNTFLNYIIQQSNIKEN